MKVTKFMWQAIWPFRLYLLGIVAVMLLWAVEVSLRPYLTKLLIDNAALPSSVENTQHLWYLISIYLAFQFIVPISWRCYDWLLLKYEPALKNNIAKTLIEYVSYHSYQFFQDNFAGSIANKINDLAVNIPALLKIILDRFFSNALILLIGIITLWQVHMGFAIAMLCWSLLFVSLSFLVINKFNFLTRDVAEKASRIIGYIVDFFGNISSVRLFNGQAHELATLSILQKDYLERSQQRRWFLLKFASVQGFSFVFYQAFCLILLAILYNRQQITPGDFALILILNMSLIEGLWDVADELRSFSENWGVAEQALLTLKVKHQIADHPHACSLVVDAGEIEFSEVEFNYPSVEPLFENKSIIINAGQKVGLVGYSGSGKSTFVNLILRLFEINKGKILIDKQNIQEVTQASLRQAIALIPQDPTLFHRSLMDNIRYGNPQSSDEEVIMAAKQAHAHEFISKLMDGYDTLVGERGIKLSGGQRQRIAIARAILKNAPILILDEATSQLDSISEQYIQESLWQLMQGKTTLIIAHRLATLQQMDRVLVFEKGKIIQDGTHQQLLSQPGLYYTLWQAQVGGFLGDADQLTRY